MRDRQQTRSSVDGVAADTCAKEIWIVPSLLEMKTVSAACTYDLTLRKPALREPFLDGRGPS